MAIGMWPFDQSHSLCKLWPQCVASPSFALERCTRCNPATHRQLPAGWPNSPPWVTMFDPQHPWTASETRESFPKKWATWNHPVKKGLKIKINYIYIHSYIYIYIYIYYYILLYIYIYVLNAFWNHQPAFACFCHVSTFSLVNKNPGPWPPW